MHTFENAKSILKQFSAQNNFKYRSYDSTQTVRPIQQYPTNLNTR